MGEGPRDLNINKWGGGCSSKEGGGGLKISWSEMAPLIMGIALAKSYSAREASHQ